MAELAARDLPAELDVLVLWQAEGPCPRRRPGAGAVPTARPAPAAVKTPCAACSKGGGRRRNGRCFITGPCLLGVGVPDPVHPPLIDKVYRGAWSRVAAPGRAVPAELGVIWRSCAPSPSEE